MGTIRLTMAQALVRYLAAQRCQQDGQDLPLFAGVWAIFGHGNVAALGEALWHVRDRLPTYRPTTSKRWRTPRLPSPKPLAGGV